MGQLTKAGNVDCSTQPAEFDRLQCVLSKLLSLFLFLLGGLTECLSASSFICLLWEGPSVSGQF